MRIVFFGMWYGSEVSGKPGRLQLNSMEILNDRIWPAPFPLTHSSSQPDEKGMLDREVFLWLFTEWTVIIIFVKNYDMKLSLSGIIFSLLFSAAAKPGESYVLTGREKSVFAIFQADLKAYYQLYEGEDINEYYSAFKTINNLGDRKLQPGEKLIFPDTAVSKKIKEDEIAKAAKTAEDAEAATTPEEPTEQLAISGPDTQSRLTTSSLEVESARAEAQRENARYETIHYYQHTLLPHWMCDYNRNIVESIEKGNIDMLVEQAHKRVDEHFAKSLVLHAYQDKGIYVLEFEKSENRGQHFFFAIKKEESGRLYFYSLEQGISFFGVGDESVLLEWQSGEDFSDLGGRDYEDLSGFLQELEAGRPVCSDDE